MARSHSIFVLRHIATGTLEGGWTVKHRMVTWLSQRAVSRVAIEAVYDVVRLRDGAGERGVIIPWEDIPLEFKS